MTRETAMTGMPSNLMSLPAEAFVRAAVEHLDLPGVTPRDINVMTQSIFRGVNKSRVWEALQARAQGRPPRTPMGVPTALVRPDDEIAIEEVLVGHAPEDDVIFLDYAFYRLVGRAPELHERLALQRDLTAGAADRSDIIARIVQIAYGEARTPVVARLEGMNPFALVSAKQAERLLLLHRLSNGQLVAAEGGLTPAVEVVEDGLSLSAGLVFQGKKQSLRPGLWRLNVDWRQPSGSVVTIAATANAGLESLFSLTLAGPASFAGEFRVLPEHLVVEVSVYAERHTPDGEGQAWIVDPRDLSLCWVTA